MNNSEDNFKIWLLDALNYLETENIYLHVYLNYSDKSKILFGVGATVRPENPNYHMLSTWVSNIGLCESRIEAYTKGIEYCLKIIQNTKTIQ